MNTSRNTEKRSRIATKKAKEEAHSPLIVQMDSESCTIEDKNCVQQESFIESRGLRYSVQYVMIWMAVGFGVFWGFSKFRAFYTEAKTSNMNAVAIEHIPGTLNVSTNKLVDLRLDGIRDSFDTAEENFIESQIGHEFSSKDDILKQDNSPNIQSETAKFKTSEKYQQAVQDWLSKQRLQGVAYKDFESRLILNEIIYHLNDTIVSEDNRFCLVWSDIDPVEKKLFFSDNAGRLYTLNY